MAETANQSTTDPRIRREQKTIAAMMRLWCRDRHPAAARDDEGLCADCRTLLDYAWQRLDNCPFRGGKPACNRCEVHCYGVTMRERIRAVMRWAGPRMLLPHPWLSLLHLFDNRREPPRLAPRGRSGGRGG